MAQLDIFEEEKKRKYREYYEWFYRGTLKRVKRESEQREQSSVTLYVNLSTLECRPMKASDLTI